MTDSVGRRSGAAAPGDRARPRAVLPTLCATRITGWGIVYMTAGMVRGNLTLLQATAITDRWGATHYGTLSGLLAAPAAIAAAIAPWAGASLAEALGGYPALFAGPSVATLAAALLATGARGIT